MAIGIRGEYPNPAKSPWSFERYHSDLERRMMDRLERDPRVTKWMKRHGITIPWIDGRSNNAAMCPIFSWSTKMVGRRSSKLRTPVALLPARCNASASRLRCGASSGTWSTGDRPVPNRGFRRTCLPCRKPSKKHECQKENLHVSPRERTGNPSPISRCILHDSTEAAGLEMIPKVVLRFRSILNHRHSPKLYRRLRREVSR
jgi:hypothetical protein